MKIKDSNLFFTVSSFKKKGFTHPESYAGLYSIVILLFIRSQL